MKLTLQNQKFRPLRLIFSIGLMMLAFHSESMGNVASPSHQKMPLTKTIPTDEQFEKNPIGMCGRACENLISCQKDEKLNKKCHQFCPKSGCVRRGKKPSESTSPTPDKPSQTQKPVANTSSQKWSPTQCKDLCRIKAPCQNSPERAQQCRDNCGPDTPCLKKD